MNPYCFNFKRIFYEAIKELPSREQVETYSALFWYAFDDGDINTEVSPTAKAMLVLMKHIIELGEED